MEMNETQISRPKIEAAEEINLLELLRVLVRNLSLIVKITAAVAILSVIYSLTLKNVYTARATLLPPQKDSGGGASALLASMGGGLAGLTGGLGSSADLYLGILKSRSVTDAVIKRLDLQAEFKTKNADSIRAALQGLVKFHAAKNGIIGVDMEASALLTVAGFHKIPAIGMLIVSDKHNLENSQPCTKLCNI